MAAPASEIKLHKTFLDLHIRSGAAAEKRHYTFEKTTKWGLRAIGFYWGHEWQSCESGRTIFRVVVKPPIFCIERLDIFFIQMESLFAVADIKFNDIRYPHIIMSSVEPWFLKQKKALIAEYTDSAHQKLRKIIQDIELADLKSLQLCKEMWINDVCAPKPRQIVTRNGFTGFCKNTCWFSETKYGNFAH